MEKRQIEIGQRFGRGVVLGKNEEFSHRNKKTYYDVMCDCGTKYTTTYSSLISGNSRSCGCLRRELTAQRFKNGTKPKLHVEYKGEIHSIREWSQITGINMRTLRTRYTTLGYRGDDLFSTTSHSTGKDLRRNKPETTNQ